MPFVTHFKSPEGEQLQIAASELVTVEIPAAGSDDLGDWRQTTGGVYYMENTFTDATAACAVIPHCTDPSAITNHGLRIEFDEQRQDWVLYIDSLPETACTLTLLFINHSTEDTPCVLPALGVDAEARAAVDELADVAAAYMQSANESAAQMQVSLGVLEQRADDLEHATQDIDSAVKELQANGGGLPEATEEDEGKFVQVVGGAYELVALQDVSKEGA